MAKNNSQTLLSLWVGILVLAVALSTSVGSFQNANLPASMRVQTGLSFQKAPSVAEEVKKAKETVNGDSSSAGLMTEEDEDVL